MFLKLYYIHPLRLFSKNLHLKGQFFFLSVEKKKKVVLCLEVQTMCYKTLFIVKVFAPVDMKQCDAESVII